MTGEGPDYRCWRTYPETRQLARRLLERLAERPSPGQALEALGSPMEASAVPDVLEGLVASGLVRREAKARSIAEEVAALEPDGVYSLTGQGASFLCRLLVRDVRYVEGRLALAPAGRTSLGLPRVVTRGERRGSLAWTAFAAILGALAGAALYQWALDHFGTFLR